jgi:hypothetical protein
MQHRRRTRPSPYLDPSSSPTASKVGTRRVPLSSRTVASLSPPQRPQPARKHRAISSQWTIIVRADESAMNPASFSLELSLSLAAGHSLSEHCPETWCERLGGIWSPASMSTTPQSRTRPAAPKVIFSQVHLCGSVAGNAAQNSNSGGLVRSEGLYRRHLTSAGFFGAIRPLAQRTGIRWPIFL